MKHPAIRITIFTTIRKITVWPPEIRTTKSVSAPEIPETDSTQLISAAFPTVHMTAPVCLPESTTIASNSFILSVL